jgi:hypothetical protein
MFMLKLEDIEIQMGRAVGGDFMKVVHRLTGIFRAKGPPLSTPGKTKHELLREIEAELVQRGLTQHILPDSSSR